MTSSNLTPTSGQLERSLSQKILALYREQLGHQPSNLPKIKQEIEKIAEVNITDFLCDTKIETGRTGVIIIFQLKSDYSPEQSR
jgi:uncharacterized protein YbcI